MSDDPVQRALPLSTTATSAVGPYTPSIILHGNRRNPYIQWLRAVAALLVMIYHTATYQDLRLHDGRLRLVFGDWCGFFGVALFFAISGYLMSIAVRVQKPGLFLVHRIIRIYPAYIAVAAAFLVIAAAMGQSIPYQASLFLLMPARISRPILGIEWTLLFEITFYVMLYVISLAGWAKHIDRIAGLWIDRDPRLLRIMARPGGPSFPADLPAAVPGDQPAHGGGIADSPVAGPAHSRAVAVRLGGAALVRAACRGRAL